jgi:hypothetical protein
MVAFSPLTSTLKVTEYKINVVDLDFIKLGRQLEPVGDVVAINSNYVHKSLDGYEQFLVKPKLRKDKKDLKTKRGGLRGDCSTFNACIEFTIIVEVYKALIVRYFPKSGSIQLFKDFNIINIFLQYLRRCGLPEFDSVDLVNPQEGSTGVKCKILLNNYKFNVILDSNKMINLSKLHNSLLLSTSRPFDIKFIKFDPSDIHAKIAIVFSNKIRVHIWPRFGKINFFGTKDALSATSIYDFLYQLFANDDSLICIVPVPDKK